VLTHGNPAAWDRSLRLHPSVSRIPHEWSSPEARALARRHETTVAQMAAQRAIYRKQQQVETRLVEERKVAIALRDQGTVDGLAYWPDPAATLLGTGRFDARVRTVSLPGRDPPGSARRLARGISGARLLYSFVGTLHQPGATST